MQIIFEIKFKKKRTTGISKINVTFKMIPMHISHMLKGAIKIEL